MHTFSRSVVIGIALGFADLPATLVLAGLIPVVMLVRRSTSRI
ncbi:hypothetical protein [Sulfuricaulis sp.]|jgi:hypothetical protein